MQLLATTDLEFAERKAMVMRTEFMAKHAEALIGAQQANQMISGFFDIGEVASLLAIAVN